MSLTCFLPFSIIPPLIACFRVKVFREFLGAVFAWVIRIAVRIVRLFVRVKAIMRSFIHRLLIVFIHRLLTSSTYYARQREYYTLRYNGKKGLGQHAAKVEMLDLLTFGDAK